MNQFLTRKNGDVIYEVSGLLEQAGVRHGFSTRAGGISTEEHLKSMNFGFFRGEEKALTERNYAIFAQAIGADFSKLVFTNQTHTTNVVTVDETYGGIGVTRPPVYFAGTDKDDAQNEVDGLVTKTPGVAIGIRIADCVPLLFFEPQARVIGAAHAGWRGTVGQIGNKTVEQMEALGADRKHILVAIGAAIGLCCYEVDDAFHDHFVAELGASVCDGVFMKSASYTNPDRYHCDLKELNRRLLVQCGILPEQIEVSDACTCCHPDIYFSHRATNGKRGTMGAMISL